MNKMAGLSHKQVTQDFHDWFSQWNTYACTTNETQDQKSHNCKYKKHDKHNQHGKVSQTNHHHDHDHHHPIHSNKENSNPAIKTIPKSNQKVVKYEKIQNPFHKIIRDKRQSPSNLPKPKPKQTQTQTKNRMQKQKQKQKQTPKPPCKLPKIKSCSSASPPKLTPPLPLPNTFNAVTHANTSYKTQMQMQMLQPIDPLRKQSQSSQRRQQQQRRRRRRRRRRRDTICEGDYCHVVPSPPPPPPPSSSPSKDSSLPQNDSFSSSMSSNSNMFPISYKDILLDRILQQTMPPSPQKDDIRAYQPSTSIHKKNNNPNIEQWLLPRLNQRQRLKLYDTALVCFHCHLHYQKVKIKTCKTCPPSSNKATKSSFSSLSAASSSCSTQWKYTMEDYTVGGNNNDRSIQTHYNSNDNHDMNPSSHPISLPNTAHIMTKYFPSISTKQNESCSGTTTCRGEVNDPYVAPKKGEDETPIVDDKVTTTAATTETTTTNTTRLSVTQQQQQQQQLQQLQQNYKSLKEKDCDLDSKWKIDAQQHLQNLEDKFSQIQFCVASSDLLNDL